MTDDGAVGINDDVQSPRRTLRLALAMRGGVSLAVWIGGAVAEIDLFRRACNNQFDEDQLRRDRGECYRKLLRDTKRYGDVEVDILAGASAGGLNAVLLGLAQSCGTVMDDIVRGTWLRGGGIWDLLREPGFGRVPSILKGDEQLFRVARGALGEIARETEPPAESAGPHTVMSAPVSNVTVELAATLLDDPGHPNRPNRARFSFTRTPGDLASGFSTIPAPPTVSTDPAARNRDKSRRKVALDRLALAARATSSFPGAFEPASIYSVSSGAMRPGDTAPLAPDYVGGGATGVNMARAFQYSRTQGAEPVPFNVVDGGIFDNIPIDRAIRAIQRAPAAQPSERFLIYLDPEPPTPQEPITATQDRVSAVSWLPTIQRSFTLKQRSESEGDELALVREHNDAVMETRGRLEALAAAMRTLRNQANAVAETSQFVEELISRESYLQYRIAVDGPRIGRLLTDPTTELCYPPDEAVDYVPLNPRAAVRIRDQLIELFNSADESVAQPWELDTDVCAMLDWTRVLIGWVRSLEDLINDYREADPAERAVVPAHLGRTFFGDGSVAALGKIKLRLYRWLTVLTEAKHRTVDEVLAAPLRSENARAGMDYPLAQRLQVSRGQQFALRLLPDFIEQLDDPDSDCGAFYAQLARPTRFLNEGTPLVTAASERLNKVLGEIRAFSQPAMDSVWRLQEGPEPLPSWAAYWTESMYPHFSLPPLNGYSIENLTKIFAVTGVPDTAAIISYGRISSREQPGLEFPQLRDAAKAKALTSWLRRPPTDDTALLRVLAWDDRKLQPDAKLAGNSLMRFGGFLHWRWRENDWQWGRLDAAAGLVKLLVRAGQAPLDEQSGGDVLADDDSSPVPANRSNRLEHDEETAETRQEHDTRELQCSIVAESASLEGKVDAPPIVITGGADTMKAISPHYRFALASRIVPLVCRAMWPAGQPLLSVPGALARLANFAARPLAVPLPLLADPLRLAAALVVIVGSAGLLGAGRTPTPWCVVFAVLLGGLGIGIMARAWRAGRNFRAVRRRLNSLDAAFPDLLIDQQWVQKLLDNADLPIRRVWCWLFGAVVVAAAFAIGGAGIVGAPLPVETLLVALAVALGVQHWLNQRCYQVPTAPQPTEHRPVLRIVLGVVTGVATVVVAAVAPTLARAQQMDPQMEKWWDGLVVTLAVAGATVAALTALSVWGWVRNSVALCCIAIGFAVGVLAQFVMRQPPLWSTDSPWWSANLRILDLLPTAVWMVALGAVIARLPHRERDYGEPRKPMVRRAVQIDGPIPDPPVTVSLVPSYPELDSRNGRVKADAQRH